jgi:PKD repeat protein
MHRFVVAAVMVAATVAAIGIGIRRADAAPVANADGPYFGVVGVPVTFNGSASTGSATGPIVSWVWDFGDGTAGSGQFVAHVYTAPGTYTVTLTVTDSSGLTSVATTTATIVVPRPPHPGPVPIPLHIPQGCVLTPSGLDCGLWRDLKRDEPCIVTPIGVVCGFAPVPKPVLAPPCVPTQFGLVCPGGPVFPPVMPSFCHLPQFRFHPHCWAP